MPQTHGMGKQLTLLFLSCLVFPFCMAQSPAGILVGDFNKVGDFVSIHPRRSFNLNPEQDSPKFTKVRQGDKELVLTYKVTAEGKGALRFYDPKTSKWIDLFSVDCCAKATGAKFWIYDGKAFKQKYDVLFFYTEVFYDTARTLVKERRLQIVKFNTDGSFRKYAMKLNPKNVFPHKLIVSKWMMREQFGEFEEKYEEYSLEDKLII